MHDIENYSWAEHKHNAATDFFFIRNFALYCFAKQRESKRIYSHILHNKRKKTFNTDKSKKKKNKKTAFAIFTLFFEEVEKVTTLKLRAT